MPEVLIICAHRPKRSPSQRYRFEQYLPFLQSHGFNFTFSYILNEADDKIFYSQGNTLHKIWILFKGILIRIKDVFRYKKYDIIFIQREASFFGISVFERLARRSGAYVIFDFDDSIWLADTSPGNKKWEWIKRPEKFYNNVRHANCVIAGNEYLAEQARPYNKNVVVLPTSINTAIHRPLPESETKGYVTIGWSGSISTIKHFEGLLPELRQIKNRYGDVVKFKVIGDPQYKNDELGVESVPWTEADEVAQLNTLDIGLMPLPDDAWAKGKCGLKGLSYMACGVATVMSAVGVNSTIIQDGENGFLINQESEWHEKLSLLIEQAELRKKFGEKGRLTVEANYSVEVLKDKYLQVFQHAKQV